MSHQEIGARAFKTRRAVTNALLCGVSLIALTMSGDRGEARSLTPGGNTVAPTAAAVQAGIAAAQQGANAAAQAQASLARAAAALNAARNLQLDAAAAARSAQSAVANGVRPGGLMQLNPAGFDAKTENCGASCTRTTTTWKTDPSWTGANGPVETVQSNSPQVRVDIKQTQQKAILNWKTFNVGADTTVNFDQAASNWIALNRIDPGSGAPSRILGQVNAPGAIYLINRNGIIFGAGSQVNIHTLVASSLDIGKLGTDQGERDRYFLNSGIAGVNAFSIYDSVGGARTSLVAGDITVERGASIKANIASDLVPLGSSGTVYLFGANVANSGSITAPTGEVAMLAARGVDLVPGGFSALPESVLGKDSSGNLLKFRGTEFRISHFASSYGEFGYGISNLYLAGTGGVRHDGLIDASRGIVIMNGDRVSVDNPRDLSGGVLKDATGNLVQGVISVDTSISRNSMVLLRAATSVTMNGVISSLPVDDGSEPLASGPSSSSTVPGFTPAYIELTAQSTVAVGASGLVSAPSAQVALRAISLAAGKGVYNLTSEPNQPEIYAQRLFNQGADANGSTTSGGNSDVGPNSNLPQTVLLAPGAVIDVAGLANVALPASYNYIPFKPLAEYADMPLQRAPYDAPLYGNTFYIDIRASGRRSDGTRWIGTPLADASGYVSNVGRSIYQLMTVGGSVSLKTDLTNSAANVQTGGSVINVAGGSVKFDGGMVNTTRLIGADGRIYSMANADPNMTYVGIAGQFTRNHARWGVTETWSTGSQVYSPGYTEGHDAGSVNVNTVLPVLAGTMYFGSAAGERQVSEALLPLQGALALTTPSSVQIGSAPSTNYTTQSPVTRLSAEVLSGYGLSALTVTANDFVVSGGSTLNLAAGGNLSVTAGGAIDIAGTVYAAGGAINLVTDRAPAAATQFFRAPIDESGAVIAANVFVGGTLDVSGRFVNDTGRTGTDLSGAAFIDGGSISITTNKFSDSRQDTTGSIVLAAGSVLDVSSGGYISSQGKPKTVAPGVMAGKAGGISLAIYQGGVWVDPGQAGIIRPDPAISKVAVLQLDGSLIGYGFESNGSLRLAGADTIRIGGTLQSNEISSIRIGGAPSVLPTALLTGGGFGSYIIESVTDDWSGAASQIIVSSGTNLSLQQQNLSSLADYSGTATGTRLGQRGAPLALLPDDQRKPVDLTLRADKIVLDTGAAIVTDPQANITLGAVASDLNRNLAVSDPLRTVAAQEVELRGSIINHGGTVFINSRRTRLGSQAVVDLSGTFVGNSRFGVPNGPLTSGTYLAGGSFRVEAGQSAQVTSYKDSKDDSKDVVYNTYGAPGGASYLVADLGATVDVSGAAGEMLIAGARGATSRIWSWSDAGTVSANVAGFAWGGNFVATGGRYAGPNGQALADGRANNGTFILGGGVISLRQHNEFAKTQLSSPSELNVAANQLAPFDNVFLYSGASLGGAARYFDELPGSIYNIQNPSFSALKIEGSINWQVASGLRIAAASIAQSTPNSTVALDAPYVLLTSGGGTTGIAGSSTLTISGQTIDVAGASFSGFSQVNLLSSGDIRLRTPRVSNTIDSATGASTYPDTFSGRLATQGDLLLQAQRIYPVSAVNFTIQTPANVTFAAPPGSNTRIPLSAGGSLTVFANTIEQGGNLFAPLGKITLGSIDTTLSPIVTQSVTLRPGSLTSVTLADTTVPYGATDDGSGWYYNASLSPLAQAPSKGIVLIGNNVTRSAGSTIDLRGGGELQAMEWIQGKGGSRDTLAGTPSGQTVYALLPVSDPVAAFDIHFTAARSAGAGNTLAADSYPLAGSQITIDGGNGIPAGTYTLYPGHYATLPGAMRVTHYADTTGRNHPGAVLPDGTVLVTGHYTQSTAPGKQSSGQSLFAVQTNAVWQQYSEYGFSRANRYFTDLAAKTNLPVSRLPMDAGRLAVIAQQKIVLDGIALTQPGRDSNGNLGRGGELDISARKLAVVGHAGYLNNDIPEGYVGLDIAQLEGFESILIGGLRSDTEKGTLITQNADSVLVDTRGEEFAAPEILLVAQVAKPLPSQTIPQTLTVNGQTIVVEDGTAPAPDSGTVTIAAGSVITARGIVHAGAGRNYYFADPAAAGAPTTAQQVATALGGTLDATGTIITGVDISRFNYLVKNADGSFVLNPDGSIYKHASSADLSALSNYSYQTTGLGALFVATNDASLKVSGPSGIAPASLTIQFASSNDPNAPGAVNGALFLPADAGRLTIQSGAIITARSATLQATASTNAIVGNSSDLHLEQLNVTARTIGLGSPALIADKSVALYNQQFSDVQGLSLKALTGVITLYGDFNPGAVSRLTLDAAAIVRAGNAASATLSVNGNDGSITLVNTGAASASVGVPANGSAHKLTLNASEIVLGGGTQKILGYGEVNMTAANRIFVAGPGSLTLGAGADVVNLNLATQNVVVGGATASGAGSFAVTTSGNIALSDILQRDPSLPRRPADSAETGGKLSLTGADILIGGIIQAQAGTITLNATAADVRLTSRAYLAAGGFKKSLLDVDTYLSGGKVVLKSDNGNVYADALSVIDVAQPADSSGNRYGYGGEIEATALNGNATFDGILLGAGGPGLGGRFKLDVKGAVDLTPLADRLFDGGVFGAIDIRTRTGNLELLENHTLKAHAVTLTADDTSWGNDPGQQFGQIRIRGRIDATGHGGNTLDGSGRAGGRVGLYAANSVLLASSGVIDASTTNADERGGDVTIGISWAAKSKIFLQQGTQINVSGGSRGGLSGGTVTFRAPLDGNNDVKIAVLNKDANSSGGFDELPDIDATNNINDRSKVGIIGARSVAVNGFVAFDTTASNAGIDGSSLGWTGTIDTAGWYKGVDQNGVPIPATEGSWTNVTGWRISSISNATGLASAPASVSVIASGVTIATLNFVVGVDTFVPQQVAGFSQFAPGQTNIPVTFPTPQTPGGVTAQGFASVDANGIVSITITNPGTGYTSRVPNVTVGGIANVPAATQFGIIVRSTLKILSAEMVLAAGGSGFDGASLGPVPVSGATAVNFERASGLTGKTILVNGTPQFVPDTSYIPATSSGVFAFDPLKQGTEGVANFLGGAGTGRAFFGDTVSQITQGKWSHNGQNYGYTNLFTRLNPLVQSLGADVVHVQPGVELVNSSGAITVASNWNLAAGTAGNLLTRTNPVTSTTFDYFDPALSHISFDYRLVTPWGGLDSGALTLRAAGNINVNASISDGFFQTGNYLDANYQAWVRSYLASTSPNANNPRLIDAGAGLYTYYLNNVLGGAVPAAPYNPSANGISPTSRDLVTADLFPHALRVCMGDCTNIKVVTSPSSWSYGFTAGADLLSANPNARISLATATEGSGRGDIVIGRHTTYQQQTLNVQSPNTPPANVTVNIPVMIRTGTGGIAISAARDVLMATPDPANPNALTVPGVIYAAGVNTKNLADPQYSLQTVNGVTRVVVGNSDPLEKNNLFFEPRILAYGNDAPAAGLYYGPPTAAAFPEKGGDVVIDAQRDIKGYVGTSNKAPQYYQPWLLSNTSVTPSGNVWGAGVFAPSGSDIASQSAWWIQYGSFQQGILSAGGNVSVFAGRDLIGVSVSAPTTGRVSGGLSADSTPVTHLYGSGNMVVRAGGNILGGSFYEGSGHASIVAGGDIGESGTVSRFNGSALKRPDVPLLAVDTGQIAMVANGAITMAGVVNPASLHVQPSSRANPLDGSTIPAEPLYMDTYGPDSKVSLVARRGDLIITIAPPTIADNNAPNNNQLAAAPSMYPASFDARALNGNLVTSGIDEITKSDLSIGLRASTIPMPGIVLSPSRHGIFNLLAQGSIDLTFGYKNSTPPGITARPLFSAGPSLIDAAFDPFRPNSGNNEPSSRAILAHENDLTMGLDTTARIYAATGDITATGTYGKRFQADSTEVYQRIEINRPTKVYAGRDLIDLNIIVQNIQASDVSTIAAGRNISYTGFNNAGGLHVAGSGFLVVQAGGDIGPFLPGARNNSTEAKVQEGIISVGNSSPTAVGNLYVESGAAGGGSGGIYNQSLLGPRDNPRRNALLTQAAGTRTGADIITMFGTRFGIDYQAVINAYINPVNAGGVEYNYAAELQAFLRRIGRSADVTDADTAFAAFEKLPTDLQQVFASQVFFAELKAVGVSQQEGNAQSQRGYQMVNTMFPSSLGYTANALGGGSNGANQLVKTGDLNLLHGTMQTKLGGDISVFGPGGNIIVGSLATEPNSNLKLPDLGILTLGGGAINTFTDQSVRVNASRVLTSQGGEILMWSSNGDLDAGRGSKTISSAPALQVLFDQDDYRSIDLSGFVTGSGIQTLRASRVATSANIYLVAPRGTIDAGTAGIGGSGVVVVIAPVIANAGNIQAQGGTVGVSTVSAPNIGALTSGSNTAGAATRTADAPTASGNRERASVFLVEVIGYGGGDSQNTDEDKKSSDERN